MVGSLDAPNYLRSSSARGNASPKACPSTSVILDEIEIFDLEDVPAEDNPLVA